ncbi:hypothetical protein GWK47_012585 [Chionoecetes opilio]|uniref:Uncharacterized protein n=1 Tax=Chionoecetes opilio TaxID=41210 RepID=A0A8J4XZ09_CHIOP|nr:hypothetical protein GWK47_012585 [Chionoecetes opilio]
MFPQSKKPFCSPTLGRSLPSWNLGEPVINLSGLQRTGQVWLQKRHVRRTMLMQEGAWNAPNYAAANLYGYVSFLTGFSSPASSSQMPPVGASWRTNKLHLPPVFASLWPSSPDGIKDKVTNKRQSGGTGPQRDMGGGGGHFTPIGPPMQGGGPQCGGHPLACSQAQVWRGGGGGVLAVSRCLGHCDVQQNTGPLPLLPPTSARGWGRGGTVLRPCVTGGSWAGSPPPLLVLDSQTLGGGGVLSLPHLLTRARAVLSAAGRGGGAGVQAAPRGGWGCLERKTLIQSVPSMSPAPPALSPVG